MIRATRAQLQQQLDDERQRSRTLLAGTRKAESAKETLQCQHDSLGERFARMVTERDQLVNDVKRLHDLVLNREAYIGRLCINQGIIR